MFGFIEGGCIVFNAMKPILMAGLLLVFAHAEKKSNQQEYVKQQYKQQRA